MKLRYKIWMENEEGKVFGEGPFDILNRVERTGSLRQAALEINMSYSQAWNLIKGLERRLGFNLLKRKVGGKKGGGSELTEQAINLREKYKVFYKKAEKNINLIYQEVFKEK
ncbi:MAG: LysR family transcriptional regulator [Candidatus Caldatribacteriota bacterium]|nr:LysR family transcriptional regulator [Candidatus Caldatribacteriota bacterium]